MYSAQRLREFIRERLNAAADGKEFIRERLAAAAEEIFAEFEKIIVRYEEELDSQRRTNLQNLNDSIEEETSAFQQLCNKRRRSSHDQEEAEPLCFKEEKPEPILIIQHWDEESQLIKEEENEWKCSLIDKQNSETNFSVSKPEEQEAEHLRARQKQKELGSGQEGEHLVQQQSVDLMETSALHEGGSSDGEQRTGSLSYRISPVVENEDQPGSGSTVSGTQSPSDTEKMSFTCNICGKSLKNKRNLTLHQRIHTELQRPNVSIEEDTSAIRQLCHKRRRPSHDQEEAEPILIIQHWDPENHLIKEEEDELKCSLIDKQNGETSLSVPKREEQEAEHLPARQKQKELGSGQEGEQLVQQQSVDLMETSALQESDLSDGEPRTGLFFYHISPAVENKDEPESSFVVSGTQSPSDTETMSFTCDICGKSLKNKRNLTVHQRIHTGEKPFSCESCGKTFSRLTILNVHKRTHTGERPYSCEICGKSYTVSGALNVHMRIHTGEMPFSCETCGKGFKQLGALNYHTRIHTDERSFSCETCGKSFKHHGALSDHMKKHTGKRPYACETCGKSFMRSGHLSDHMRTHTGERPFSCATCGRSFTQSAHLNAHMRTHSREAFFF